MTSYENKLYVRFTRAEWRAFLFGREAQPRRTRWLSAARWLRWEAFLLTRLPGDTVRLAGRDVVWLIHGGRPGHLRGWAVSGYAVALHRPDDLWDLVAHNPRESWLPALSDVVA